MNIFMRKQRLPIVQSLAPVLALVLSGTGCSEGARKEVWRTRNDAVVKQHNLKSRERVIADNDVVLALEPGRVYESSELPVIRIAPGVAATVSWGRGALLELLEMENDSLYPEQTLTGELITVVQAGSATFSTGGDTLELTRDAVLYLTPENKRSLKAGPEGFKAIEVFSPVRVDHLELAGVKLPASANVSFPDQGVKPSLEPGRIYNLNEIQWVPIQNTDPTQTYRRSPASSRLIWGKNAMLSLSGWTPIPLSPFTSTRKISS